VGGHLGKFEMSNSFSRDPSRSAVCTNHPNPGWAPPFAGGARESGTTSGAFPGGVRAAPGPGIWERSAGTPRAQGSIALLGQQQERWGCTPALAPARGGGPLSVFCVFPGAATRGDWVGFSARLYLVDRPLPKALGPASPGAFCWACPRDRGNRWFGGR